MHVEAVSDIRSIGREAWNRLLGTENPFLRYEFLAALEDTGCVGERAGWIAHHLVLRDGRGGISAAAPAYVKLHSYGEYVFDWAWASAYARAGLDYYPKLVLAVPFTPVTGSRFLRAPGAAEATCIAHLQTAAQQLATDMGASSVHCLFLPGTEVEQLEQRGWLRRAGYQFHWQNRGFSSFDHFLEAFSAQKRKKIKRERRAVRESGVTMEVRMGADILAEHWAVFYECYRSTIEKHGAIAYLNQAFFAQLAGTMASETVLVLARKDGRYIAAALNFCGPDALFGRYWGSLEAVEHLHFETCYYTPIEFCIARGLGRFEAGAQGEHKLSRGLLPSPTYSAHWLSRPDFARAIGDFLMREESGLEYYMNELSEHGPFKRNPGNGYD